ncbi:PTS sugar transporter subunit IIA [uncultured Metabacillus sp.]|uniref:PTS sugar transporter subunit IIA n=1 Tax=uncultured Metabacillus sp. TaxID=2860135 RepID=UPI002615CE13|nr:PTS sugar transporter subunit IIA [uncultured Metabacillus sp.]
MGELFCLDQQVVFLDVEAEKSEEVITFLYEKLKDLNYVKESFLQAILERENVYPTGLPLANMGVAIPHTDPEHIVSPMISFAKLYKPVQFQMMGNPGETVDADIVFMLAIKEPEKQLVMLERLMGVFQNEETMSRLQDAKSAEAVTNILNKELNRVSN